MPALVLQAYRLLQLQLLPVLLLYLLHPCCPRRHCNNQELLECTLQTAAAAATAARQVQLLLVLLPRSNC
jgi:hypothetical protein